MEDDNLVLGMSKEKQERVLLFIKEICIFTRSLAKRIGLNARRIRQNCP